MGIPHGDDADAHLNPGSFPEAGGTDDVTGSRAENSESPEPGVIRMGPEWFASFYAKALAEAEAGIKNEGNQKEAEQSIFKYDEKIPPGTKTLLDFKLEKDEGEGTVTDESKTSTNNSSRKLTKISTITMNTLMMQEDANKQLAYAQARQNIKDEDFDRRQFFRDLKDTTLTVNMPNVSELTFDFTDGGNSSSIQSSRQLSINSYSSLNSYHYNEKETFSKLNKKEPLPVLFSGRTFTASTSLKPPSDSGSDDGESEGISHASAKTTKTNNTSNISQSQSFTRPPVVPEDSTSLVSVSKSSTQKRNSLLEYWPESERKSLRSLKHDDEDDESAEVEDGYILNWAHKEIIENSDDRNSLSSISQDKPQQQSNFTSPLNDETTKSHLFLKTTPLVDTSSSSMIKPPRTTINQIENLPNSLFKSRSHDGFSSITAKSSIEPSMSSLSSNSHSYSKPPKQPDLERSSPIISSMTSTSSSIPDQPLNSPSPNKEVDSSAQSNDASFFDHIFQKPFPTSLSTPFDETNSSHSQNISPINEKIQLVDNIDEEKKNNDDEKDECEIISLPDNLSKEESDDPSKDQDIAHEVDQSESARPSELRKFVKMSSNLSYSITASMYENNTADMSSTTSVSNNLVGLGIALINDPKDFLMKERSLMSFDQSLNFSASSSEPYFGERDENSTHVKGRLSPSLDSDNSSAILRNQATSLLMKQRKVSFKDESVLNENSELNSTEQSTDQYQKENTIMNDAKTCFEQRDGLETRSTIDTDFLYKQVTTHEEEEEMEEAQNESFDDEHDLNAESAPIPLHEKDVETKKSNVHVTIDEDDDVGNEKDHSKESWDIPYSIDGLILEETDDEDKDPYFEIEEHEEVNESEIVHSKVTEVDNKPKTFLQTDVFNSSSQYNEKNKDFAKMEKETSAMSIHGHYIENDSVESELNIEKFNFSRDVTIENIDENNDENKTKLDPPKLRSIENQQLSSTSLERIPLDAGIGNQFNETADRGMANAEHGLEDNSGKEDIRHQNNKDTDPKYQNSSAFIQTSAVDLSTSTFIENVECDVENQLERNALNLIYNENVSICDGSESSGITEVYRQESIRRLPIEVTSTNGSTNDSASEHDSRCKSDQNSVNNSEHDSVNSSEHVSSSGYFFPSNLTSTGNVVSCNHSETSNINEVYRQESGRLLMIEKDSGDDFAHGSTNGSTNGSRHGSERDSVNNSVNNSVNGSEHESGDGSKHDSGNGSEQGSADGSEHRSTQDSGNGSEHSSTKSSTNHSETNSTKGSDCDSKKNSVLKDNVVETHSVKNDDNDPSDKHELNGPKREETNHRNKEVINQFNIGQTQENKEVAIEVPNAELRKSIAFFNASMSDVSVGSSVGSFDEEDFRNDAQSSEIIENEPDLTALNAMLTVNDSGSDTSDITDDDNLNLNKTTSSKINEGQKENVSNVEEPDPELKKLIANFNASESEFSIDSSSTDGEPDIEVPGRETASSTPTTFKYNDAVNQIDHVAGNDDIQYNARIEQLRGVERRKVFEDQREEMIQRSMRKPTEDQETKFSEKTPIQVSPVDVSRQDSKPINSSNAKAGVEQRPITARTSRDADRAPVEQQPITTRKPRDTNRAPVEQQPITTRKSRDTNRAPVEQRPITKRKNQTKKSASDDKSDNSPVSRSLPTKDTTITPLLSNTIPTEIIDDDKENLPNETNEFSALVPQKSETLKTGKKVMLAIVFITMASVGVSLGLLVPVKIPGDEPRIEETVNSSLSDNTTEPSSLLTSAPSLSPSQFTISINEAMNSTTTAYSPSLFPSETTPPTVSFHPSTFGVDVTMESNRTGKGNFQISTQPVVNSGLSPSPSLTNMTSESEEKTNTSIFSNSSMLPSNKPSLSVINDSSGSQNNASFSLFASPSISPSIVPSISVTNISSGSQNNTPSSLLSNSSISPSMINSPSLSPSPTISLPTSSTSDDNEFLIKISPSPSFLNFSFGNINDTITTNQSLAMSSSSPSLFSPSLNEPQAPGSSSFRQSLPTQSPSLHKSSGPGLNFNSTNDGVSEFKHREHKDS